MVCVDYSDFLSITLPLNARQFDKISVVTTDRDIETINLCKKYENVEIVKTNRMYENGSKFNKGKAINDGLKSLSRSDWVLITDSDMVHNDALRDTIKYVKLQTDCIYGTSRFMCPDYSQWLKYLDNKTIAQNWINQCGKKVIGVGFFQLVNGQNNLLKNSHKWYSEDFGHCGRSDRMFLRSFEINKRKRIDLPCIHLGSDEMSANWYGRITKRFS